MCRYGESVRHTNDNRCRLSDLANFFILLHNLFNARLLIQIGNRTMKKNSKGARVECCDKLGSFDHSQEEVIGRTTGNFVVLFLFFIFSW
jgi:hypothetical protein